jgi:hypothetical protein
MLNVHLTNTTTDLLRKVLAAVAISATALAFIGAGSAGTRNTKKGTRSFITSAENGRSSTTVRRCSSG